MPTLTMECRERCLYDGSTIPGFYLASFRINKKSLRSTSDGLTAVVGCRLCGHVPEVVERWRLDAESQATVTAYRQRKGWT